MCVCVFVCVCVCVWGGGGLLGFFFKFFNCSMVYKGIIIPFLVSFFKIKYIWADK